MDKMLPLDTLSDKAIQAFKESGVDVEKLVMAVTLDLTEKGTFGQAAVATDYTSLYVLSFKSDENDSKDNRDKYSFCSYKLCDIEKLSLDSFVSSCRVIAKLSEQNKSIPICFSTNAKKQYLNAFITILEKEKRGVHTTAEDSIFEQFNICCPKCGRRYNNQARKICRYCVNKSAVFKRLLKYFSGHKHLLFTMLVCMISTALISLISPYLSGVILYDKVLSAQSTEYTIFGHTLDLHGKILPVVGAIFMLALLSLVIGIIQSRSAIALANRVTLRMKLDIFTAIQHLSLAFFTDNQTGRLITRVNYDAERIKNFFTHGVPYLIVNCITFIGILIILLIMNPILTGIVLIPVPLILIIVKKFFPKIYRMHTKIWRRTSALNSFLGDSLNGIRIVKSFAKEAEETRRFSGYNQSLYKVNLQYNALSLTIFPVMHLLISLSGQVIWGFGGMMVMGKQMDFGALMTFIGYLGMIYGPLEFFASLTEQLTDTANSAQRMFEILDAVPDINESKNPVDLKIKGDIKFENVCFHYKPNRQILNDINIDIKAGENVGLVGHTGSGKSTIANLITRLYDTVSGTIYIDGVNIKDIKIENLRKSVAIVSQEIFLFRGTIADNIRYAKPEATMEEVIAAAKAANAHDFIEGLPLAYETQVGVSCRALSGGEQQRISIARAILLNPSILILDEATAAMDTETERQIQQALHNLTKNRTTIVIAHRLSTLRDCTRIYAIEHGKIVEGGTKEELLEKKGVYHRLYTLQAQALNRI